MIWFSLISGFFVLAFSGDLLVRGAVDLSKILKVSPFIVAGTLVAFGTSAPELFVSITASLEGSTGAALGNILGSNFANVFLALGMAAIIQVVKVPKNISLIDVLTLLIFTVVFSFILLNLSSLSKWFGLILILTLFLYLFYSFKSNKLENKEEDKSLVNNIPKSIVVFIIGLVGITLGAGLLVDGAINLAKNFGIREAIIGVGVLAFGTSLPEVATSVIAAIKKQNNIAVGNIIGSSIFNILAIGGATLLVSNNNAIINAEINIYDLIPFILASLLIVFFYKYKFNITKLYGFFFVIFYILWITLMFLN